MSSVAESDVVIIGGGFAGVTAARNLTTANISTTIIEARPRLGGRAWTTDFAGAAVDLGGKWIHWFQPHVFAETTRYGVGLIESPAATRCLWRTSEADGDDAFAAVWEDVVAGAEAFFEDSARLMPRPHEPGFDEGIVAVDDRTVADRLRELELSQRQRDLLATLLSLCCSSDIAEAGYATMVHWHALSGWNLQLMFDATFRYKPRNGTGELLRAMLAEGDAEVVLGDPVIAVEHGDDAVRVHTASGRTHAASAAVVAVPLNCLADIDFDPPLSAGKRAAAAAGQASRGFNSWVRLRGDLRGLAMLGRPDDRIAFMNAEYLTDEGTVFFAAGRDASIVDVADPRDVEAAVREHLPSAEVVDVAGHNWLADPFTKGTWSVFRPLQLTRVLPDLQRREGRLIFAGSDTASGWNGFIDGAIETGHRAAREVRALGSGEDRADRGRHPTRLPDVEIIAGARAPLGVIEIGRGPAVLVLHGFPDHAAGMLTVAAAIAGAGGRAIVPALPGYLPSPLPADGDVRVSSVARDLVGLLDALEIDTAAVVGHDWGALLAYELGATHAARVTKLVGLSAPHPSGFRVRRRIVREQQTAAYAWLLAYARTGPELASDPTWLTQLAQSWSPGLRRDDWDDVLALLARRDVAEAVCRWYRCDLESDDAPGDVRVPATVIHGAQDGCIGPAVYLGTDDRFVASVKRITLPELGHWPHLEAPDDVLPLIVDGLGL